MGRSLLPLMRGDEIDHRPAWLRVELDMQGLSTTLYGLSTGERKIVLDPSGPGGASRLSLFDLIADAGERVDLAAERPDETEALASRLAEWRSRIEAGGVPRLRASAERGGDQTERLRALGYVE